MQTGNWAIHPPFFPPSQNSRKVDRHFAQFLVKLGNFDRTFGTRGRVGRHARKGRGRARYRVDSGKRQEKKNKKKKYTTTPAFKSLVYDAAAGILSRKLSLINHLSCTLADFSVPGPLAQQVLPLGRSPRHCCPVDLLIFQPFSQSWIVSHPMLPPYFMLSWSILSVRAWLVPVPARLSALALHLATGPRHVTSLAVPMPHATCLYFLPVGLVASPHERLVPCTASECLVLTKFESLLKVPMRL